MPGKTSNRDRIAKKAAEAVATERQKTAAKDTKESAKPKAASKSSKSGGKSSARSFGRIKIVWLVCNPSGGEVKVYPYAQEAEARSEAAQMTTSLGKTHFVRRAEVPVSS